MRFDLGVFLQNIAPHWLKRVGARWQRLHRCKAVDWSMVPRALCVLNRKHRGLHEDEDGYTWLNHAGRYAERVEVPAPETAGCPCDGACHKATVPCSLTCIVCRHQIRDSVR